MPNYRQKNRNRNKNKNRNKQPQSQQQQQLSQQKENSEPSSDTVVHDNPAHISSTVESPQPPPAANTPLEENVIVVGDDRKEIEISEDVPSTINDEQNVITCGTVPTKPATACNQSPTPKCNTESDPNMGNEKSKLSENREEVPESSDGPQTTLVRDVPSTPTTSSRQQAKVIVHRIVCEDSIKDTKENKVKDSAKTSKNYEFNQNENDLSANTNTNTNTNSESEPEEIPQKQVTVIVHKIHLENSDSDNGNEATALSPVHIEEVGDESLTDVEELKSPIVSEADSAAEWDDGDFEQSSELELSSTTSVSQREKRKQKRIALENHFLPQMLNPRFLDSISEENSDLSECGDNPLSRSASAESAANTNDQKSQKLNAKFPKSSLDFSKTHKHTLTLNTQTNSNAIREEPLAFAVEAHFQETPVADESCTTLKSFLSPEAELAEMVFINSASSSMSDLNELDHMDRVSLHSTSSVAFDLDTDAKDLINKPGTENRQLTSSSSAAELLQSSADKGSNFVNNNSRIPSSSSSPAIHQLVLSTDEEEQNPQSTSMLFSYGSGPQRFADADAAQRLLSDTQASSLETSCDSVNTSSVSSLRADKNAKRPPEVLTENVQNMNTVRDIISTDTTQTANTNDLKTNTATTADRAQQNREELNASPTDPKKLRLLCAETLAALPYGGEVLEELATLAQNIGEVRAVNVVNTQTTTTSTTTTKRESKMPYPLPELPHIDDLRLSLTKVENEAPHRPPSPNHPESWLGVPTSFDPKVLVCLSPSQRSFIEQQQHQQKNVIKSTNTKEPQQPDDLLEAHQKFVERRGYHEFTKEQLAALEQEKLAEQQLLQTAAMMKKLRKSLTPPPPQIPPPPVPTKSSETATIAQNLSKRSIAPTSSNIATSTIKSSGDVTCANEPDKTTTARCDGEAEENKHRLLSIIQDTSDSQFSTLNRQQQTVAETSTSSFENNSRQTTSTHHSQQQQQQQQQHQQQLHQQQKTPQQSKPSTFIVPITLTNGSSDKTYNFPSTSSGNMQSVESSLGEMFPTLGSSNIFDREHKRFSNIESSSGQQQPLMDAKPKRYSSVETHSYESQKRIENGQVVHDYSNSEHDRQNYGEAPPQMAGEIKFPSRTPVATGMPGFSNVQYPYEPSMPSILTADKAKTEDHEIMSALKLNNHSSATMNSRIASTSNSTTTTTTENSQSNLRDEVDFVKQNQIEEQQKQNTSERMTALRRGIEDTYEEFRQRAKEAAVASAATATTDACVLPTAQVTSNGDSMNGNGVISALSSATTAAANNKTVFQHDHEKLFKEFDDLSKQLNKELETSKTQREQKERSASLYDLNRIQLRQKEQIEEFNKQRHEHMNELEREIERSMKSRQLRMSSMERSISDGNGCNGRAYQIPIQMENGYTAQTSTSNDDEAPPVPEPPRTYQIPIQIDNSSNGSIDSRFRRAESMFNLNAEGRSVRTNSGSQNHTEDDWSKYASDLGSSENIARPFAREVEICYQRRPGGIKAPRLTASTNDLSYNSHSYDTHNAYNVRRSHQAPMLNKAPQQSRPHYGSCYSMIERDPNPKYISTTSRRGVSPAPQPSGFHPMEVNVSEEQMRQRRASLPRELHEQQLKYIASKEEELRTEFERLQKERLRLMEEVNRAQAMPMPQPSPRPLRDSYRCVPKLPTLTEDEVFRQQMAEEWLNKVAEREKRRLQNIIKISKVHEEDASEHMTMQKNLGDEFLNRVKERRSKLDMPADSDWESGAESHPANQAQSSEAEDVPPVKILEGEHEASLRSLPRHLREFAKFSNHQRDEIEGGHREQHQEEERSQETTDNSVSKAFKKSTVIKTVKTVRAPMLSENGGHGRTQGKANGYQSEPEPISYDSDYSTVKYRPVNPQRLHSVSSALNVRSSNDKIYGTLPNPVKAGLSTYKNQPGRIEDYVTGHSSVSEKETKEWWDEVMDIFNVHLDQAKLSSRYTEGNLSRALAKESGYTSDTNLILHKKEPMPNSPLSPIEQRQAYKSVQAGGEPPLFGFRKPAPEKSKVSPNRYYESDVNIHFKTPVRQEFKSPLSEEELAIRQAEQMQKLYQEERRRKYLQELQDMNSRRHTDNFIPSQKSPIALNRYDDFPADLAPKTLNQTKSAARALYNFQAQNSKELSFKKGDIIYIRRAIDKNWYEGEHNAMIGLFPANYVEVITKETIQVQAPPQTHRSKPSEGQARAKYNFQAQSGVELSLNKGELVALTRRVDDNWFEGRIANRKGIFPVAYVEVLTDIGAEDIAAKTTTIQQTSTVNVRPSLDALRTNINNEFNTLTRNGVQAPNSILRETRTNHKTDILHVDTSSEPLVYRALYKYRPQNSDELELLEGDVVHVLEKCDDGWYVGTSQRTGCFGTFPGNYVERL